MDKDQKAIERLKTASEMSLAVYGKPLLITTSGGKDSGVLVQLAQASGIPFEVSHSHTTADAPETVRFVRQELYRLELKGIKCSIEYPTYKGERVSMWTLIPQKLMPPTRVMRYCCEILKETAGKDRFIATGVRWAESAKRLNRGIYENITSNIKKRVILNNDNDDTRKLFENCQLKAKRVVNPIIDWTDDEVWDYTKAEKIPCNPLYCEFSRVGCIGCPMAGKGRQREFARYPQYQQMYIHAFDRMLEERKRKGRESQWQTGRDVFHWWMEDGVLPGQIEFDDLLQEEI